MLLFRLGIKDVFTILADGVREIRVRVGPDISLHWPPLATLIPDAFTAATDGEQSLQGINLIEQFLLIRQGGR